MGCPKMVNLSQTSNRIMLVAIEVCFILFFINVAGLSSSNSIAPALYACLFFMVAQWFGTFSHELGHAFAGLARGMTLLRFSVGCMTLDWTSGRMRVLLNKTRGPFAGHVLLTGWEPTQRGITDNLVMVLGGPIAESLFGLLLIATSGNTDGWVRTGLLAAGSWSLLHSVLNLLPLRIANTYSDGGQLRLLMPRGPEALERLAAGRWLGTYLGPEAPGNWPDDVVQSMEEAISRQPPLTDEQVERARLAGTILYFYYADRREWVEATHVIATAADLPRARMARDADKATDVTDVVHGFHLVMRGRNPLAARSALRSIHPKAAMTRNSLFIGTQSAIALAEGEPLAAYGLANEAKKLLAPTVKSIGVDRLEDSWWDEVIESASTMLVDDGSNAAPPAITLGLAPMPTAFASIVRDDLFAWDPGVPSDLRTVWIWRSRTKADLEFSA